MGKDNLRIAVAGAGLIGRKHIDVVRTEGTLDAIIDPAPAAKAFATSIDARWWADLDTYLAANQPDGVIIASPNALHLAHGLACLNRDIPVLIEKPLAENADAANTLQAVSVERGIPVLVGHHRRHSSIAQRAQAVINEGKLGRLVTVSAQFWLHKPDDYFEMDWRTKPGAGPIYINLIHDIDLLRSFCGEVVRVSAIDSNSVRNHEVEDSAAVILFFANGVLGTISISDCVSAPWSWELTAGENDAYPRTDMSCYQIGGTQGSLSVPDLVLWSHLGAQSWWNPIEHTKLEAQKNDPIVAQFRHFLRVLRREVAPLVSAEDGARNIAVLDAIKLSAATGQSVSLPLA